MKRPSTQFYRDGWKGSRWITCDAAAAFFPAIPACYVVYLDGKLSYIGQTSNLQSRVSAHGIRLSLGGGFHTKWGYFSSVIFKIRYGSKMGDWAMREVRLIHRIQPPLNRAGIRRLGGV
jgi:hypothetical protein